MLAQRNGRHAEQRRFHRCRHRAGIGYVLAKIAAGIDARERQGGPRILHDELDRQQDAVGRRAIDGIAPLTNLADAQGAAQRQRMTGAALLPLRGDDPDIGAKRARHRLEDTKAGRVDAIVVRDQNARRRQIDRSIKHRRQ